MDNKLYASIVGALLTVAAIGAVLFLAVPIVKPLAWALIIGTATMPHYNRILAKRPGHPGRAAGLMVLLVTICFILPVAGLVTTAAVNAPDWYRQIEHLIQTIGKTGTTAVSQFPIVQRGMELVQRFGIDIAGMGGKVATTSSTFILNSLTGLAKNLFNFLFILAVALFLLFFIYRDGERAVALFIGRLAPNPRKAQHLVSQVRSITTAVAVGTILTCCTQGVIAGLGYWVAGVPAPIFLATLTAIAALIPVVGTALIWVPVVVIVALNGSYLTAALLAGWCLIFVGFSDNAIRPLAIGAASDVSVLAVVVGAICGVVTMGLLGLILGPLVFAVLFSLWDDAVHATHPSDEGEIP